MGRFAEQRPNVYAKKEGGTIILAIVLLLLAGAMSFFGLPKEDTSRNQWLSCVYNTVPEQFNPNIRVCLVGLKQFIE